MDFDNHTLYRLGFLPVTNVSSCQLEWWCIGIVILVRDRAWVAIDEQWVRVTKTSSVIINLAILDYN